MENRTTGNVMFTVLAYACGRSIAVTCRTLISVLLKFLLQLSDRLGTYFGGSSNFNKELNSW